MAIDIIHALDLLPSMTFSKSTITELRQEIASLAKQRADLIARSDQITKEVQRITIVLQGITAIIDEVDSHVTPLSAAGQAGSSGSAQLQVKPFAELGIRDAIRQVLSKSNHGLRPIEVTRELVHGGYSLNLNAKTPFNIRVGNELHRMAKENGKVKRHKTGKYRLTS